MEPTAEQITPDEIDATSVASLVPDVVTAQIGSELVVVGSATQGLVLNPSAALLLHLFDGVTPLGDLIEELSEDLDIDRDVIERDVLSFARDLGSNGFLVGVGVGVPEPPWPEWAIAGPEPLAVGGAPLDFALPDLDGNVRSLSEFEGRQVLLVNWSPGCGYCLNVVGALAAEEAAMRDAGTELVFLALGSVEANRSVMDEAGVHAPVLLRDGTDVDPFTGTGTPAALLLDTHATLVEPMVIGATEVPVLAARLGRGERDGLDDDVRYLPAPSGTCAPGTVGSPNATSWSGTRAYRLGGFHVGLRHDSEETADQLDRLFPGARVVDARVPTNYSVALSGASHSGARGLNLLVRGSDQVVRSRSAARVLSGLLARLSNDLSGTDPRLLAVRAIAALRGDEAFLLPEELIGFVTKLQPRFARVGIRFVDDPRPAIDAGALELVVPEPSVEHDPAVLAAVDLGLTTGAELPRVQPGRYPLSNWFLFRSPELPQVLTPAIAAVAALRLVEAPEPDGTPEHVGTLVTHLGELFTQVRARPLWYQSWDELVAIVTAGLDD